MKDKKNKLIAKVIVLIICGTMVATTVLWAIQLVV